MKLYWRFKDDDKWNWKAADNVSMNIRSIKGKSYRVYTVIGERVVYT